MNAVFSKREYCKFLFVAEFQRYISTDMGLLQIVMPKFPVIVKIGHAYAGMGKVCVVN